MGDLRVRLPDSLHDQIRLLAEEDRRSLNNEIIVLLEQALTQRGNSQ